MGSLQTVPCNITHTIYVPLHVHLVLGDNHSNCFLSDPSDFPGSRLLPELSPDNRFNMPKSQFTILFSKTLLLLVNFRHPPLRHPSGKSGSYPRLLLTPASPVSEVPTMPFLCCTEIRSSIPMPLLLLPFGPVWLAQSQSQQCPPPSVFLTPGVLGLVTETLSRRQTWMCCSHPQAGLHAHRTGLGFLGGLQDPTSFCSLYLPTPTPLPWQL